MCENETERERGRGNEKEGKTEEGVNTFPFGAVSTGAEEVDL